MTGPRFLPNGENDEISRGFEHPEKSSLVQRKVGLYTLLGEIGSKEAYKIGRNSGGRSGASDGSKVERMKS
jgi:hypothetical protein